MTVYLDHNVYIDCLDGSINIEYIKAFHENNSVEFVYGPGHMEEIYRVESDENSPYREKMKELLLIIKAITNSREILPSLDGLSIVTESPERCYQRVKSYDTTQRVEEDSLAKFIADTEHYKKMLAEDKHNQSISNLSSSDVWENTTVKAIVNDLNSHKQGIIQRYNNSPERIAILLTLGIDRGLPKDFSFEKGQFNCRLRKSFKKLEFIIEILMRVLNFCGYFAEKDEKTAVSSTHDVTHCIYGTKCNHLITMDKRFAKKCQAVYDYLGVNTEVWLCLNSDYVIEALKDIVIEHG